MTEYTHYIIAIIAIIIAIYLIKRFVGCLIRTVIGIVLSLILAYIYYMYIGG